MMDLLLQPHDTYSVCMQSVVYAVAQDPFFVCFSIHHMLLLYQIAV